VVSIKEKLLPSLVHYYFSTRRNKLLEMINKSQLAVCAVCVAVVIFESYGGFARHLLLERALNIL